jgi:glutamate-1-semialdehyde 2,1-aminomutase
MVQSDRMEIGGTAFALYGLGASVAAAGLVALRRRLQLTRAKHASFNGHAKIARRIASLVPFYAYDEDRFFRSDNAPLEIAARRRDGFRRLSALYASRFGETDRRTAEVVGTISDLQFTQAYRAPASQDRGLHAGVRWRDAG